tara:strand:- start:57 stop:251 length:195 start_codon:yes stop_codon:yes gene_type:complete
MIHLTNKVKEIKIRVKLKFVDGNYVKLKLGERINRLFRGCRAKSSGAFVGFGVTRKLSERHESG